MKFWGRGEGRAPRCSAGRKTVGLRIGARVALGTDFQEDEGFLNWGWELVSDCGAGCKSQPMSPHPRKARRRLLRWDGGSLLLPPIFAAFTVALPSTLISYLV